MAQLVENTCHAGDLGSSPGLGRSPEEGNGHPLQYSGLENSMDCIVHGVAKSRTQLNNFHLYLTCSLPREQDSDWVGIFDKRKMSCHLLWRQRVYGKEWSWPLRSENNLQLMANKELGTIVLWLQGIEFCLNLLSYKTSWVLIENTDWLILWF